MSDELRDWTPTNALRRSLWATFAMLSPLLAVGLVSGGFALTCFLPFALRLAQVRTGGPRTSVGVLMVLVLVAAVALAGLRLARGSRHRRRIHALSRWPVGPQARAARRFRVALRVGVWVVLFGTAVAACASMELVVYAGVLAAAALLFLLGGLWSVIVRVGGTTLITIVPRRARLFLPSTLAAEHVLAEGDLEMAAATLGTVPNDNLLPRYVAVAIRCALERGEPQTALDLARAGCRAMPNRSATWTWWALTEGLVGDQEAARHAVALAWAATPNQAGRSALFAVVERWLQEEPDGADRRTHLRRVLREQELDDPLAPLPGHTARGLDV